ncbi:rRNA primary transcript metabolism protein [Thoreauomyces humboldtii]|nr:rRNA primary transcript metabolism protein [Thoreauomyces humboldtii]
MTVNTPSTQTAESVTKLLRDSSQTAAGKLEFASDLWRRNDVFVPGKSELLLEWITSELFNGTKKKDGDSLALGQQPHLNLAHWAFFNEVVEHFIARKKQQESRGNLSTSGARNHSVKARVMDVFTALFEDLTALSGSWTVVDAEAARSLMDSAHLCFRRLSSSLVEVLRPTLEQYIPLGVSASKFLLATLERPHCIIFASEATETILASLSRTISQQPNQKKIFSSFISKLMGPLMQLRHTILITSDVFPKRNSILEHLQALFQGGLFHKEHMADFAALLHQLEAGNVQDGQEKFGYPKQLLDSLRIGITSNDTKEAISEASTAHSKARANASSPAFAMFHQLHTMLASSGKPSTFATSVTLLESCHQFDIYRATNDEVSKQQLKVFEDIDAALLTMAPTATGPVQVEIIRGWRALLLLDHTIIADQMSKFWPYVLLSAPEARSEAVLFCCALLRTFTKARQLDTLILSWLQAVRDQQNEGSVDGAQLLPICTVSCLQEFSQSIRALLPAQVVVLVESIRGILIEHHLPSAQTEPARKKRKMRKAGKQQNGMQGSAELPITFLCLIVQHAQVSVGQRAAVDKIIDELFSAFIEPILAACCAGTDAGPATFPALSLHLSLLRYAPSYWTRHSNTIGMISLIEAAGSSEEDVKTTYIKNEIALCHLDRVASTTVDPVSTPGCSELAAAVLKTLLSNAPDFGASWDLRLSALDETNISVASWISVAEHLPAISRLAGIKIMRKIVDVLVSGLEHVAQAVPTANATIGSVVAQLLQSVPFYELGAVQMLLVPALLARAHSLVSTKKADATHAEIVSILTEFVSAESDAQKKAWNRLGTLFVNPATRQHHAVKSSAIRKCMRFLEICHAFPTSYYHPEERDSLVGIIVLLELVSYRSMLAAKDADKRELSLRFGLACRTLSHRLMRNREERVLVTCPPAVLIWYLDSLGHYAECQQAAGAGVRGRAGALAGLTFEMLEFVVRKAWHRFSAPLPRKTGSASAAVFKAIFDYIGSTDLPAERNLQIMACFMRPTAAWFEAKSKRMNKDTAHITSPDVEAAELLSGGFLAATEAEVISELNAFAASKKTDGDCALLAFESFQCILRYHKTRGDAQASSLLELLVKLVSASTLLLGEVSPTGDGSTDSSSLPLFAATCISALAENLRDITPSVSPAAMKNIAQLIGYILDSGDIGSAAREKAAFAMRCLVRDASKDQYLDLVAFHLDELEHAPARLASVGSFEREEAADLEGGASLITALDLILAGDNRDVGRSVVRRVLPNVLVKIGQYLQVTSSVTNAIHLLEILARIASDKFLNLRHSDVALILSSVVAVTSPSSRLAATLPAANRAANVPVPQSVLDLFDGAYKLLLALLRFRKLLIIQGIPSLAVILKDLLLCFRVSARIIGFGPRTVRSTKQTGKVGQANAMYIEAVPLLAQYAPLPVASASNLARLLVALGQKAVATSGPDSASTSSSNGTSSALLATSSSATVKPFTKHAPFLLTTIIDIQASSRPFPTDVKEALMEGIYALLDLCGDHGRETVLAALDPYAGGRPLVKALVADWEMYHRYTGKV